ncbi:MAG: O-antigen ligase family protein [Lachnospiraceae bacterium]|nr:O-antigen ligase family protein [Lachnospiraceae bacterium]
MKFVVSKQKIFFLVYWITYFKPPILERISIIIDRYWYLFHFLLFALIIGEYITNFGELHKKRMTAVYIFTYIFLLWCAICVMIKEPSAINIYITEIIHVIELIVVFKITFFKYGEDAIKLPIFVSKMYLAINFISMIFFPKGLFYSNIGSSSIRAQWILGSKNSIPIFILVFNMFIMLNLVITKHKSNGIYVIISLFSIVYAGANGISFLGGSSAGIVAITIGVLLYIYIFLLEKRKQFIFLSPKIVAGIIIFANVILLGSTTIPIINDIIVNVFHKSLDFSGRRELWKFAFCNISKSIILGHGASKFGLIRYFDGITPTFTTYVYNMLLRLWLRYGIVSIVLYFFAIFSLNFEKNIKYFTILIGLFTIAIFGLLNEIDLNNMFICIFLIEEMYLINCKKM